MLAWAEDVRCALPNEELGTMINQIVVALKDTCKHSAGGAKDIEKVIRSEFMTHVDSSILTKQVLGRKYWFDSDQKDREKLQKLLEVLLIRQYAGAFNCKYVNSKVEVHPLRGQVKRYSKVDSDLFLIGEKPIQVKYSVRCDDTEWKVVDIVVDGLSIAQTYRSQFNRLLSQGGIKRLNEYLETKLLGDGGDT